MDEGKGNRIRELRESRNLSGTKLAEMLGVSPQYLYDLEKGERRLNESLMRRLAAIFGVSVDYLLGIDGPTDDHQKKEENLEDAWPEVLQVLRRAGRKPTPEERRRIARIIEAAVGDDEEK